MRQKLQPVGSHAALASALGTLGPQAVAETLRDGCGFRVRSEGKVLETTADGEGRYRLGDSGLRIEVSLEQIRDPSVVVQQLRISYDGTAQSPPIDSIDVFYLPLAVRVKNRPRALAIGGGSTNGFYPPNAYREDRVNFGQDRQWEPSEISFTRFWVAQRFFKITSGPDGRSSDRNTPIMEITWEHEGNECGLWAALEWSGRWEIELGTSSDWSFYFRGGPQVKGMRLDPGESIVLPKAHLGVFGSSADALEEGGNAVRSYLAEVHSPDVEGKRPWPYVAYHHWFGIEHHLNDRILRKQVDRASELGLEYFEVDAGWYGGASENFANGVGNWERVDEQKFPDGLEPFARYVHDKGLRFGLWFEPERGRLGSDWVTEHPDWYWKSDSPVNFHLDLTKKDVQDYLIEVLSGWIKKLDIRWLRWDNNQSHGPFWDRIDPTGKVQFAYFAGLYRVWDTILARHPNLMIDNCAGGGQRSDFGTLKRAGTMVISDHSEDPHVCRIMQTGGSRFLPGNYVNSSIYKSDGDGDRLSGPFELASRMSGAISLSGTIAEWSAEHVKLVRRHLDGFKTYRHLLMRDFYRLTAYPRTEDDWDVVEFLDRGAAEAVVLAYRFRGSCGRMQVVPKYLADDRKYTVGDPFGASASTEMSGKELLESGIEIELTPNSARVLHLKPAER